MDNILEEEAEILNVFDKEMTLYGHKGFYSLSDNIENGYYIYKDDGKWIYDLLVKGEIVEIKEFTNVYNLCLDIINELKMDDFYFKRRDIKIPSGTKVIISKSTDCVVDKINDGIIVSSSIINNPNSKPERIYQVLGSDGETYEGLYGLNVYGDTCFRTMEDYIRDTKREIDANTGAIHELHETNCELYLVLDYIKELKEEYLNDSKRK